MSQAGPSRRRDGRQPTELRPLIVKLGELDRADGSGRFGFGPTAALASFSGPLEVRLREELPDRATFEVTHRPLEGIGATPSRALETTLHSVIPPLLGLSQHPRSLLQLVVQSLSPTPAASSSTLSTTYTADASDSASTNTWPPSSSSSRPPASAPAPQSGTSFSARAAALNASTLAVLDAGSVSVRALPFAVALAFVPPQSAQRNGEEVLVLDPSAEEEAWATSRHVFGWAFGNGISAEKGQRRENEGEGMDVDGGAEDGEAECELVWAESEGDFSRAQFGQASAQSKMACRRILSIVREKLGEHLEKRLGS